MIDNTARPHHSVAVPDPHPSLSLVAVRDHRERAIQLLTDSFANDLISIEEFERRLGRLHAAGGLAEVDAVVADLRPAPAGAASTSLAPLRVDAALTAPRRRVTSLFGNVERRGAWTVPAELEARAVFGHVELDFRDARFSAATTELDVRVVFGALEIIVPPQLAVECEGSSPGSLSGQRRRRRTRPCNLVQAFGRSGTYPRTNATTFLAGISQGRKESSPHLSR